MKIIHNNEIEQITFLDERYYFDKVTGLYQPSVTTYLDVYPKGFGFVQWLKDMGNNADEVVRRAGEQGSKIHDAIQTFLKGEEIKWVEGEKENYTIDEWKMILKFVDFYKTWKPKTIAVEVSLVDSELGYGATLDYVCELPAFPGEVWYIDWKSGAGIWKTNKIQSSAYVKIWNKLKDKKITRFGCFHLRALTKGPDKTNKQIQGAGWKLEEITNGDHLFSLFEHTQKIWHEENPNPQPKNVVYPDRVSIKSVDSISTDLGESNDN